MVGNLAGGLFLVLAWAGSLAAQEPVAASVVGRVIDAEGKPLAGVTVGIGKPDKDFPMQQVLKRTTTDADGRFTLPPVRSGDYEVCPLPEFEVGEGKRIVVHSRPLPATFLPRAVKVQADEKPVEIELTAVPHVTLTARFIDGIGMPTVGGRGYTIAGKLDKATWRGEFFPVADRPDAITAIVPLGLKELWVRCGPDTIWWSWFPGFNRQSFMGIRLAKIDADRPDIVAQRVRPGSLEIRLKVAAGELPNEPQVTVFPEKDGDGNGHGAEEVAPGVFRMDGWFLPGRVAEIWVSGPGIKNLRTRPFQLTEEGQKGVLELTLVPGKSDPDVFSTKDAVPVSLRTPEGLVIAQPDEKAGARRAIACRAVDNVTGLPVAGAVVTFGVEAWKDEEGEDERIHRTFDETEVKTDADGRFTILVAERFLPDPAPKRVLHVRVTIRHPKYLSYWDTADTREIAIRGISDGFPEFRQVKLVPAREVFGRLLGPDGQPLAKVTIYKHYDMTNLADTPRDSDFPETDADGRFRFNVPARAGFQAEFRARNTAQNLFDFRADQTDLGDIRLSRGAKISGRVVDAAGKPVRYISVTAPLATGPPPMSTSSYSSEEDGSYRTQNLVPGRYRVHVGEIHKDDDGKNTGFAFKDAPGVYIDRVVELKGDDKPVTNIDFRPVESVRFVAKLETTRPEPKPVDPKVDDVPLTQEEAGQMFLTAFYHHPLYNVRGKIDGVEWVSQLSLFGMGEPRDPHAVAVPKGLDDAILEMSFYVQRFRVAPGGPELFGPAYRLGRVDADRLEIQFRRYAETMIQPRYGPFGSKAPAGLKIEARYVREPEMVAAGVVFKEPTPTPIGAGDRLRYPVLPDEEVELTATAPGQPAITARVKLAEGETREVRLIPKPDR